MPLVHALSTMQKNVPECVAVGLVDLKTGALLGMKTVDREVVDRAAGASGDALEGSTASSIEALFKKVRGAKDDGQPRFHEILVMSDNRIHAFLRCKRNEDMVLVTVCRASANLGMVLAKTRATLPVIEAHEAFVAGTASARAE